MANENNPNGVTCDFEECEIMMDDDYEWYMNEYATSNYKIYRNDLDKAIASQDSYLLKIITHKLKSMVKFSLKKNVQQHGF